MTKYVRWSIFTLIIMFFSLDISMRFLGCHNVFANYSIKNKCITKDILTVDSILTGATFTFIIISFSLGNTKEETLRSKIYWASMPLWIPRERPDAGTFSKKSFLLGLISLSFLSPLDIILLSTLCTALESAGMVLEVSISAIVFEILTLWLLLAAVMRNKLFNDNVENLYLFFLENFDKKKQTLLVEEIEEIFENADGSYTGGKKKRGRKIKITKDNVSEFIRNMLKALKYTPEEGDYRKPLMKLKSRFELPHDVKPIPKDSDVLFGERELPKKQGGQNDNK